MTHYTTQNIRATGRSTAAMYKAISDALLARGTTVPFIDHEPLTGYQTRMRCRELQEIIKRNGLHIQVSMHLDEVFLRSTMNDKEQ